MSKSKQARAKAKARERDRERGPESESKRERRSEKERESEKEKDSCVCLHGSMRTCACKCAQIKKGSCNIVECSNTIETYGVATISRLLQIICLFCKRDL